MPLPADAGGRVRRLGRAMRNRSQKGVALSSTLLIMMLLLNGCTNASSATLPSLQSPIRYPAGAGVQGPITSPGGPYLYDQQGRVVFFHGVNAVYKHPPYELFPAPGKPWDFTSADASLMARLGFNVVRLGMTWKGLEPGTARSTIPPSVRPAHRTIPGQFNKAVLDTYLRRVKETVDLLGRFHIYTLLDMHQDVYNELFDGEGAPNWAVCTGGASNTEPPGRWSQNYGTAAAGAAFRHFWTNDVVGDLQGEYDRVWAAVASSFAAIPGSSATTRSTSRSRPRWSRPETRNSTASSNASTPGGPSSAARHAAPRPSRAREATPPPA